MHEAAVRETEKRDVRHDVLRCKLSSERNEMRAGPEDIVPRAKLGLWLPEELIRFAKSLCPRDAHILQEVIVGAFGDLTQRAPLARARDPAGESVAPWPDPAGGGILATVGNGRGGAERPAKGQDGHNRLRCGLRRRLDGRRPSYRQSIFSRA